MLGRICIQEAKHFDFRQNVPPIQVVKVQNIDPPHEASPAVPPSPVYQLRCRASYGRSKGDVQAAWNPRWGAPMHWAAFLDISLNSSKRKCINIYPRKRIEDMNIFKYTNTCTHTRTKIEIQWDTLITQTHLCQSWVQLRTSPDEALALRGHRVLVLGNTSLRCWQEWEAAPPTCQSLGSSESFEHFKSQVTQKLKELK